MCRCLVCIVSLQYNENTTEINLLFRQAPWNISDKKPRDSWPEEGRVVLDNYSLRYREGLDLVLKKINVEIMSGEKVGEVRTKFTDFPHLVARMVLVFPRMCKV